MSEFGRSILIWYVVGFCLILSGCSSFQWLLGLGSSPWIRVAPHMDTLVLHPSFIRCFQPQEAQCLRCKNHFDTACERRWYKVKQDLSGDEARYNSEMDGCTHFAGPFGTRKQKAPCWTILNWHACTQVRGKWQARSTEVFNQGWMYIMI